MRPILVTGFEPFGGDERNPSREVLGCLPDRIAGRSVRTAVLGVDGRGGPDRLAGLLDEHGPAAVLMLGLASGRPQLSLERVAVNRLDHRTPDNSGRTAHDEPLLRGGPDAYLSNLPLDAILAAWREAGIPGAISNTAGLFLCNAVFFHARHALGDRAPAGFLHLPDDEVLALTRRSPGPYLPLEHQARGVRIAVETIAAGLDQRPPRGA